MKGFSELWDNTEETGDVNAGSYLFSAEVELPWPFHEKLNLSAQYMAINSELKLSLYAVRYAYLCVQSLIVITSYSDGKVNLLKFANTEINTSKYFAQ